MENKSKQDAFFIADNVALDFLNSVAAPSSSEIEWITNDLEFENWLLNAGLISTQDLAQYHEKYSANDSDELARQARKLREWFRGFVSQHAGKSLTSISLKDVEPVNEILTKGNQFTQMISADTSDNPLQLQKQFRWTSKNDLLLPICESIANLICNIDFKLIKNCEGPTCTLWFYDISKNRTRRWCSMSVCGNRAKVAAHRAKQKLKKMS